MCGNSALHRYMYAVINYVYMYHVQHCPKVSTTVYSYKSLLTACISDHCQAFYLLVVQTIDLQVIHNHEE